MSREKKLEEELKELRRAKEALLSRVSDCMNLTEKQKAELYDDVVPIVRSFVERIVKGETSYSTGEAGTKQIVFEKLMVRLFSEDWLSLLGKV